MNAQKGKALAQELIDDLLDDESAEASRIASEPDVAENSNVLDLASMKSKGETSPEESPEETFKSPPSPESAAANQDLEGDKTARLQESKIAEPQREGLTGTSPLERSHTKVAAAAADQVRASVGRFAALRQSRGISTTDASLAQAENLRIAQSRILELENEMERLRIENEQLAAAGETLRRKADETLARAEHLESKYTHLETMSEEEKQLLQNALDGKEKQIGEHKRKIEELEMRLSTNIQKIRVRERELENRLELVRMESSALVRSKDEMILDLKRQVDQLTLELDNYRNKGQDLNRQLNEKQDMLRRTVKALRLSLSMLEGDEETVKGQKKSK